MYKKSTTNNGEVRGVAFDHAIVIGSSIAGLTAARVLTDHFARVTIIERDHVPETPEFRPGVPQARHAHTLMPRGQVILEQEFPGLVDELLANGATAIDSDSELAYFAAGAWRRSPYHRSNIVATAFSRPLLETRIYQRLAAHPAVDIIQEHEVLGLVADEPGKRVTGVRLRKRHASYPNETELMADLVVDASGRDSKAPQWLQSLGYTPPRESTVNAFPGYATRIYLRPTNFTGSWKSLYILPTPPDGTRGGVIIPIEDNRWYVTLIGIARDYPPTDEEGFLAFASSLPSQRLYEAIKDAEPLTKPYGYRRAENRLRHYDQLPHYLEGFLVFGDAVYTLNPIYAMGMTVAAMGSLALDLTLQVQRRQGMDGDLTGLTRVFQKQLGKVVAGPWQMATRGDQRWTATESADEVLPARHPTPSHRVSPAPALASFNHRASNVVNSHYSRAITH